MDRICASRWISAARRLRAPPPLRLPARRRPVAVRNPVNRVNPVLPQTPPIPPCAAPPSAGACAAPPTAPHPRQRRGRVPARGNTPGKPPPPISPALQAAGAHRLPSQTTTLSPAAIPPTAGPSTALKVRIYASPGQRPARDLRSRNRSGPGAPGTCVRIRIPSPIRWERVPVGRVRVTVLASTISPCAAPPSAGACAAPRRMSCSAGFQPAGARGILPRLLLAPMPPAGAPRAAASPRGLRSPAQR